MHSRKTFDGSYINNSEPTGFIPIDSWWLALEEWWLKSTYAASGPYVTSLKLATILYDFLIIPMPKFPLLRVVDRFSDREGIAREDLLKVWIPATKFPINNLIPKDTIEDYFPDRKQLSFRPSFKRSLGLDYFLSFLVPCEKLNELFGGLYKRYADCQDSNDLIVIPNSLSDNVESIIRHQHGKRKIRAGYYRAGAEAVRSFYGVSWKRFGKEESLHTDTWMRVYATLLSSLQAVDIFARLSKYINVHFLAFNTAHDYLFEKARGKSTDKALNAMEIALGVSLPSVTDAPWREIFRIRKASFVKKYRRYAVHGLSELSKGNMHLSHDVLFEALLKLTGEIGTQPGIEAVKAGASLVPLPINPFALYESVQRVAKADRLRSQYAWAKFVFSLKKTLKSESNQ